jgi:hypothetical protein
VKPETSEPAPQSQRTQLNLLGQTDTSSGESRRNENVQFNLIDNNSLRELNLRVGNDGDPGARVCRRPQLLRFGVWGASGTGPFTCREHVQVKGFTEASLRPTTTASSARGHFSRLGRVKPAPREQLWLQHRHTTDAHELT